MAAISDFQDQAWIVVLIIAVVTSILTLVKVKGKVGFKIGFSIFRGFLFFLLFYIPLFNQPRISGVPALPIVGIFFLIFGLILTTAGIKQLVRTDLTGVKGIPDEVITDGLYSIIRHPVNLGLMFTIAGWFLMWAGIYSLYFLVVFLIVFVVETRWEEKNLEKEFGDSYREYKQNVGMFFPKIKAKS
ncbi:MAG: isoprenylcysteine carboxylmethyltransferase family protein [Anaerolineales bacterium]